MRQKGKPWLKIFRSVGLWISVILCLGVLLMYVLSRPEMRIFPVISLLEIIETKTLDLRFRWRGEQVPDDDVVIVAVNEKTDDELGRWQSSGRRWVAMMLDILREGGAKVVGFDVTFAEPDEGAALVAVDEIKAHFGEFIQEDLSNNPQLFAYFDQIKQNHDYDQQLAEAIQRAGNVVLGIYHFFDETTAAHLTPEQHEAYSRMIKRTKYPLTKFPPGQSPVPLAMIPHSFGLEPNLQIFSDAAKSFGHFNPSKYIDGYIRKAPLLAEYKGGYYPSLDLEIVRIALNLKQYPIIHALKTDDTGIVDFIQIGDIVIPTDEKGYLLINYYGKGEMFRHFPISDVVLGRIPPETFKNKIVLLGYTSFIYQDLHSTTFQPNTYPGVEIHATIIENILHQNFLQRPFSTVFKDVAIILLLGVILGIVLPLTRPLFGALFAVVCLIAVFSITYWAFMSQKIWINVTFPALFIILDYLTLTIYKYFTEERKKKQIKLAFQHYVSPTVVDQMLNAVDQLHLGGERKDLTAFFSDIRGFTSISEKMTPENLVKFLNEYLTAMAHIVLKYEGTVDKYMGDAIMAFYGAPLPQPDHAMRACKTAIEMMTRLNELRQDWRSRGFPAMNIGIGINSGEMSVGNMGSEERFDYTIMGDNVNLASRLEGINKQYGTNIVISEFTYERIREHPFIVRELDSVRVKGKTKPVTIYELIGYGDIDPQIQRRIELFHQGLTAYKSRQWKQAIASFQEVLHTNPDDEASRMYIVRCEKYIVHPPSADWDGAFVMETK